MTPIPICAVSPVVLARARDCAWPTRRITIDYLTPLGPWSRDEMRRKLLAAGSVWAQASGLTVDLASEQPHIAAATCRVDGPSGTLAWSELPCGGVQQVRQCYDTSERWVDDPSAPEGSIDIISVLIHELGHALGLDHAPEQGNVMYAYYSGPRRELGPWDIAEIRRRYGDAAPSPPGGGGMDYRRLLCVLAKLVVQLFRCDPTEPHTDAGQAVQPCRDCEAAGVAVAAALADVAALVARRQAQE